ncbi:uncharacterized protein LOC124802868 [Schistocerca piceifrons]|uniref:uncharacterized protein LOC124802868 n=1 Tax=Schistocerca piceifrons TaxID=274613 RepID=UPI001F5F2972|nr:uncharacterized protein LOC124802868 [Schistocerca piceifrons]
MKAVLAVLLATAALTAASRFGMPYGRAVSPGAPEECCQDGVPVCSQLSRRLRIPDLGCELLCRGQGQPGSLGCSYRAPVPACSCRNDAAPSTAPPPEAEADSAAQPELRMLGTRVPDLRTLPRTRF